MRSVYCLLVLLATMLSLARSLKVPRRLSFSSVGRIVPARGGVSGRLLSHLGKQDKSTGLLRNKAHPQAECVPLSLPELADRVSNLQSTLENMESRQDQILTVLLSVQTVVSELQREQSERNRREMEEKVRRETMLPVVRDLCERATDDGRLPLCLATIEGNVEGVKVLLSCTQELLRDENETVKQAMSDILNGVKNINAAFKLAVELEDLEIASVLITHDPNLDNSDSRLRTLLHISIDDRNAEMVSLLLEHGAKVEGIYAEERTPLQLAAENGFDEIVSILLAHGANKEAKRKGGMTPLLLAAKGGHADAVSVLIAEKADINATDNKGCTPLHLAASSGCVKTVALLLKHTTHAEAKDKNELTPLEHAKQENIKNLLRSWKN